MTIEFVNLRDYPDCIVEISAWHYAEWGHLYPTSSQQDFADELRACLTVKSGIVPMTLLLVNDGQVIGTACILEQDMTINHHLSPWLANVYMVPAWRGKGLGYKLVSELMAHAQVLGLTKLFLFTCDQVNFYQRLGWTVLNEQNYQAETVAIMSKSLTDCKLVSLRYKS